MAKKKAPAKKAAAKPAKKAAQSKNSGKKKKIPVKITFSAMLEADDPIDEGGGSPG